MCSPATTPVLVHNASGADLPPIVANGIQAYQNGELSQRVVRDRVTGLQVPDAYTGFDAPARVKNYWGGARSTMFRVAVTITVFSSRAMERLAGLARKVASRVVAITTVVSRPTSLADVDRS